MNINSYIIKDYISFPIYSAILNSSKLELNLAGISFLASKNFIDNNYITIAEPEDLLVFLNNKVHNYSFICFNNKQSSYFTSEKFQQLLNKIANSDNDLIVVNGCYNKFELYEDLQSVFIKFTKWEQEMNLLLDSDAPLKSIGNSALPFLYNPISMYTPSLRNIFFSERNKKKSEKLYFDEDIDAYLPDEDINELKFDEEFIGTVNEIQPAIFSDAMWGHRILFYNIRISGIYVARIMSNEIDRPLRDSDDIILLFLSEFLKKAMKKKNLSLNNHPKDFDSIILQLLEKKEIKNIYLEKILQDYHWKINDQYFCIVISISTYDQAINTVNGMCARLEANFRQSASIHLEDYILMIVNISKSITKSEILSSLVYLLREGFLKAGISSEFNNFNYIADYYEQAKTAIKYGNLYDETLWYYNYEDYALTHLIDRAPFTDRIISICPDGLIKLIEYDKRHNRNFVHSLKIYLRENMNIANTIRKLYLQRATFLYQIKRIKEITELDLDDYKIRLRLLIIFELMDARN